MKNALHFGAGKIGRGFIGPLLSQAGYDVCFADANRPLVEEINRRQRYVVHILDTVCEDVVIRHVSAVAVGDADVIRLIMKFGKELDEEREGYVQANRLEDAEKIAKQKEAISVFLPKMLSEEEIRGIIAKLDDKSIPSVMKHFKANYDGQVDMGLVNKIARSL